MNIVEDLRPIFQLLERKLGFLNAECCDTCCGQEISIIQSHILYEIHRRHHPSMQEVAGALGMDISTFSRQIKTLVEKGLVKKTPNPDDQRVQNLSLTPEGVSMENRIHDYVNTQLNALFSRMTHFERETVLRSLQLLIQTMEKAGSCCIPLR